MNVKELGIVLVFALVGWALCGATMGVGMAVTTGRNALIIHAAAVPIFFGILSWIYHRKFNYTTPLQTAAIFAGFVVTVDFFVVALLMLNSLEMFTSPRGTWIPFALIFMATYLAGRYAQRRG